jgi:hypothetical protein
MSDNLGKKEGHRIVIACNVMKPELEWVSEGGGKVEIHYLDQGLHRSPQHMAAVIQEKIDAVRDQAAFIVLGYGLCSNGIVGLKARSQPLIIPRCHDCIAFFLGSPEEYIRNFRIHPGTYYLTPGWVAAKKDPLGIVEEEYAPRYGRETAVWIMEEELKHYTHIALIDTGIGDILPLRKRAQENARFFRKDYREIRGSLEFFRRLLNGPYTQELFFFLPPGKIVRQEVLLDEILSP